RLGGPGRGHRGHRAHAQDAGRGGDADGPRRPARAHVRPAGLRAGDDLRGRRPARAAAGGRPGAGGEDRPQLTRRHGGDQAGAVGGAGDRADRGVPQRRPGAGVDVGPPRPDRGPGGVRRAARAPVGARRPRRGDPGRGRPVRLTDLLAGDDGDLLVHAADRDHIRGEVRARAAAITAALADAGVGPGHPVAVMAPNGVEVVAALFGVWGAGGVHVPLNPRLTDAEVERVLATVRPAAVVATPALAPRLAGHPAVVLEDGGGAVRRGPEAPAAEPARHDGDVALVQFTSGTTGAPKPVLLRHSGVIELIDGVLATLRGGRAPGPGPGPGAGDRRPMPNLVPVSLSLWAGIYTVLFAFRVGAPVVVMDGFDTLEFARLVARFRLRSTVLPPAAMAMLVDDERVTSLEP